MNSIERLLPTSHYVEDYFLCNEPFISSSFCTNGLTQMWSEIINKIQITYAGTFCSTTYLSFRIKSWCELALPDMQTGRNNCIQMTFIYSIKFTASKLSYHYATLLAIFNSFLASHCVFVDILPYSTQNNVWQNYSNLEYITLITCNSCLSFERCAIIPCWYSSCFCCNKRDYLHEKTKLKRSS